VLDGARDADRDVELRRDDLAGLADLVVVGHEAGIDRGARGAQRGAELVGQRLEQLVVVLAAAHAATAGDDDLGGASSGRSDLVSSRPTSLVWPRSAAAATASTAALPPSPLPLRNPWCAR
jgi:hypothetical protein